MLVRAALGFGLIDLGLPSSISLFCAIIAGYIRGFLIWLEDRRFRFGSARTREACSSIISFQEEDYRGKEGGRGDVNSVSSVIDWVYGCLCYSGLSVVVHLVPILLFSFAAVRLQVLVTILA